MQQLIDDRWSGFQPLCRRLSWLIFVGMFCFMVMMPPVWAAPHPPSPHSFLLAVPFTRDRVDEISVEKIRQFIQAYLDVIHWLETQQRAQSADANFGFDPIAMEKATLQRIEAAGLTRQEYLQLLNLANTDRDFSDRIAMQLQEFSQN